MKARNQRNTAEELQNTSDTCARLLQNLLQICRVCINYKYSADTGTTPAAF